MLPGDRDDSVYRSMSMFHIFVQDIVIDLLIYDGSTPVSSKPPDSA